ncbi:hypothetical protein FRC03_007570 [Tulasnella sp. 419]|nr:hypothetical protein FRC03_007570 [Tulasnella sp. 419]
MQLDLFAAFQSMVSSVRALLNSQRPPPLANIESVAGTISINALEGSEELINHPNKRSSQPPSVPKDITTEVIDTHTHRPATTSGLPSAPHTEQPMNRVPRPSPSSWSGFITSRLFMVF